MAQLWGTSSVHLNEAKFNWKITNFSLMLNPSSTSRKMSSPEFKVGSNTFWLHITEKPLIKFVHILGRNGACVMNQQDYSVVTIEAKSDKEDILTAGHLTIDMEGERRHFGERIKPWLPLRGSEGDKSLSGVFGDPTINTIYRGSPLFKNETAEIKFHPNPDENTEDGTYFLINRLVVSIEMKVHLYFRSPIINSTSLEPTKDTGLDKLSSDMRVLYESAESSDFNIECGGKSFPCHSLILRARSSVLDAMFRTEMKETSERRMTVEDVGPGTVAAVLEYLYTGGITAEVDVKELIYIADKYDMKGLMELCFRKLPVIGDDMVVDFLLMADKHNFVEYKKAIMLRINMDKAKYMEDQRVVDKILEVPRLLLELYKL